MKPKEKKVKRFRRHRRVRAKILGTAKIPRLNVFRSNKHIYGQLINDEKGIVIVSISDFNEKVSKKQPVKKTADKSKVKKKEEGVLKSKTTVAYEVGKLLSEKAKEKGISKVLFDRGGYKYHGRVKALADGAREGGLKF